MVIYKYFPDLDRFAAVKVSSKAVNVLRTIRGEPLAATWTPLPVQLEPQSGELGDFPGLSGFTFDIPVLSERAWKALEPLLGPHVEALPLKYKLAPLFALNVLKAEDCLDMEKTKFARFDSGTIYAVEKYVFRANYPAACPLFWALPACNELLATKALKTAVEKAKLRGLLWHAAGKAA